jgi:hypothetical protein
MNGKLTGRGLVAGALTATVALALAACSGHSGGHPGRTRTTAPSAAPATKAASTPKAASALSGRWSGHYSGSYNGTFTLRWRQSGSQLQGTIHLSNPAATLPINGIVHGTAIRFGTVGSTAITYAGNVSGNSMTGTYQVHTASGTPGGPWSASKA